MAYTSALLQLHPPPPVPRPKTDHPIKEPDFPFPSLEVAEPARTAGRAGMVFGASLALHASLLVAVVLLPLLLYDAVPELPDGGLRAFFAAPPDIATPPPPPPPPAPAALARPHAPVEVVRPLTAPAFTAPIDVPDRIVAEQADLGGDADGVPGGVEGGVPGGVVGGVIGGIVGRVPAAPPEPPGAVRVGGQVAAPKLVHTVRPEYPEVARMAHLSGIVVLEAVVGTDGRVESVKALNANPVLEQAAIDAVAQWRYKPLLLNGVPTRFILTVTITFSVREPGQ